MVIRISIGKNFIFAFRNCFEKNIIFMFFLLLSYNSRTILLQILISPRFSIHWCPRIWIWIFGRIRPLIFWKTNCSESFCILLCKTSTVGPFLNTLAGLPGTFRKSSLEQLFCGNLLAPASVKKNSTENIISKMFQNFKNMQGKTGGCNLKACNLL